MLKKIFFSICLLLNTLLFAQDTDIVTGRFATIYSDILKQNRVIQIGLPLSYNTSQKKYPVLYILDGSTSFEFAVSITKFLSHSGRIPEMIVVGITNVDRTFDLTPSPLEFRKSGNGKNFMKFLTGEVRSFIDNNYRTMDYNIFSGHSLGGNMTIYSLFENPDNFDAYIAVSPYLASGDYFTLNLVKEKIADLDLEQKYLYVTIGNEPPYFEFMKEFSELIKNSDKDDFTYIYENMNNEDHSSIRLKAVYNALENLFKEWILSTTIIEKGIGAIEDHFEAFEEKYGYEYKIPEHLLNNLGYQMMVKNKTDIAIGIFYKNTELYPNSANAFHSLGDAYKKNKNFREAKKSYEEAVKLAEENNHPRKELFKKGLKEIQKYIFNN